MLTYSYPGRVIFWSDLIKDRYLDDDEFARELRIEVAVRLAEAQLAAWRHVAPPGASWTLHLGEVVGVDAGEVFGLMEAAQGVALSELEAIERDAAAAILRRQRHLAAETARVTGDSSGHRTIVIDTLLTRAYAPSHVNQRTSRGPGRAAECRH